MGQLTKKLLIISGTIPPEQSATALLIKKLLPYFQKAGYQVEMLTVKNSFLERGIDTYDGMNIYRADSLLYAPAKRKCLRDYLFAIYKKLSHRRISGAVVVYKDAVMRAMERTMEKMPMDDYDAVIAVCAYYEAAEALRRYIKKHPLRGRTILYQVDPLAENKIYIHDNETQLQQYEKDLYDTLDHIFTTPIIYKAKQKIGWDLSNVTALEFPISLEGLRQEVPREDQQIQCVYAGFLYGALRDASYALDLFSKIKDSNIHLYMVGKGQEELLRTYENNLLKGRLHILGEKSASECDEILLNADILVNIGNTVNNQVPSKLLHYISFRKPILNITACEDCPTVSYTSKYPLALTIQDTKMADEATAKATQEWLQENCRRTVGMEDILRIFKKCTPEHIANTIMLYL